MWLFFGVIAIAAAILNLARAARDRDPRWFRFASLACTALALCSFYSQTAKWVAQEDWSALMDVVPTMEKGLWLCAAASILINSLSLFQRGTR